VDSSGVPQTRQWRTLVVVTRRPPNHNDVVLPAQQTRGGTRAHPDAVRRSVARFRGSRAYVQSQPHPPSRLLHQIERGSDSCCPQRPEDVVGLVVGQSQ
jgi:hypothetical protein